MTSNPSYILPAFIQSYALVKQGAADLVPKVFPASTPLPFGPIVVDLARIYSLHAIAMVSALAFSFLTVTFEELSYPLNSFRMRSSHCAMIGHVLPLITLTPLRPVTSTNHQNHLSMKNQSLASRLRKLSRGSSCHYSPTRWRMAFCCLRSVP